MPNSFGIFLAGNTGCSVAAAWDALEIRISRKKQKRKEVGISRDGMGWGQMEILGP